MINFGIRNLKVFFKDKSSVFFSLLSVFIIIGLYALFLGDMLTTGFGGAPGTRFLMDTWIMAGMLAVSSITTTMGAFGAMVEDKSRKIDKDFIASPIKNSSIVSGYVLSSIIIGIIMSLITVVLMEIYVVVNGGELMNMTTLIKTIGLVLLSTISNSSIVFFVVSFFKSNNSFATASTVIGTLIGFLTGIYIPIGQLPEVAQWFIKCFPPSHAASLFRHVLMEVPMSTTFSGAGEQAITEFKQLMGVEYAFGNAVSTPLVNIIVLVASALVFFGLSIWNVSRKRK